MLSVQSILVIPCLSSNPALRGHHLTYWSPRFQCERILLSDVCNSEDCGNVPPWAVTGSHRWKQQENPGCNCSLNKCTLENPLWKLDNSASGKFTRATLLTPNKTRTRLRLFSHPSTSSVIIKLWCFCPIKGASLEKPKHKFVIGKGNTCCSTFPSKSIKLWIPGIRNLAPTATLCWDVTCSKAGAGQVALSLLLGPYTWAAARKTQEVATLGSAHSGSLATQQLNSVSLCNHVANVHITFS